MLANRLGLHFTSYLPLIALFVAEMIWCKLRKTILAIAWHNHELSIHAYSKLLLAPESWNFDNQDTCS